MNYIKILLFFLKDIKSPFIKLYNTLSIKWNRGLNLYKLKKELIKDLEIIKENIISNNEFPSNLSNIVDDKTIKILKLDRFINKLKNINRGSDYSEIVDLMFDNYYKKLDKKLLKIIFIHEHGDNEEVSSMDKSEYKKDKIELQIELVKLQEWAINNDKKIAIVFEGRDAAGKGSSIKRFVEYINPKFYNVVALGIPTKEESNNWLPRYEKHLPKKGEISFFDRSWYNRAVVEPTMGYCNTSQYEEFMNSVNEWEEKLINDDVLLFKFWFSIDQEKQLERFELRKDSPLKHWKFSPNDEKTITKWDVMTKYKEQMFTRTSTPKSPWVVINSNDKRVSRLNSIRYILSSINYTGKDYDKKLEVDNNVVKILN